MAPEGKSGLIVSLLYDYRLAKRIEEYGWSEEIRLFMEKSFIDILDESTFPGIKNKISGCFSSSPLTIEKRTRNTEGGITGWAFTNPFMPSESRMLKVAAAVDTPLPSIFQAGQWVYSPSGFPISILTGRITSYNVCYTKLLRLSVSLFTREIRSPALFWLKKSIGSSCNLVKTVFLRLNNIRCPTRPIS